MGLIAIGLQYPLACISLVKIICRFHCEGSSSIGSISAQFLAAFSAAAGKRSLQFSESEESDPDVSIISKKFRFNLEWV